jgi:hypothetical protein
MRFVTALGYFVIWLAPLWISSDLNAQGRRENDPFDDFIIGEIGASIGQGLGSAMRTALEYRQGIQEMGRDLAAARARFWREYPDGPNSAEASKEFAIQLVNKDLLFMHDTVLSGMNSGSRSEPNLIDVISKFSGANSVDGGIRPIARRHFYTWTDAVRRSLVRNPMRGFPGALENAAPAYQAYRMARDYAEFVAAGKLPPGAGAPGSYVRFQLLFYLTERLFDGDGEIPPPSEQDLLREARAEAQRGYEDLIQLFGRARVHSAAERVMKAPLSPSGEVTEQALLPLAHGSGPTRS